LIGYAGTASRHRYQLTLINLQLCRQLQVSKIAVFYMGAQKTQLPFVSCASLKLSRLH